jgi:hypothetical protein
MFAPRTFKRLNIAYNSERHQKFFLEKFAYYQWNNKLPFTSGPAIMAEPSQDLYDYWSIASQIECSLRYYMKPHKILVFGNEIDNITKSHLLVRGWLNATKESNNALILMERIDFPKEKDYMVAINNSEWRPMNLTQIEDAAEIKQTLTKEPTAQNYYSWKTHMDLVYKQTLSNNLK